MSRLGQLTCETVGAVETSPSHFPFKQFFSPTDFDFAVANIASRIATVYSGWKQFSLLGFTFLGVHTSGEVKAFVATYITVAAKFKKSIKTAPLTWWESEMQSVRKVDPENLRDYLKVFEQLSYENQIPKSILEPFDYVPQKGDIISSIADATGITFTKVIVLTIGVAGIYAFASGGYKHLGSMKFAKKAKT